MGDADVKGIGLANDCRAWWGFPRETEGMSLAPRVPERARGSGALAGPGGGRELPLKCEKGYNLSVPAGPGKKKQPPGLRAEATRASREAGPGYAKSQSAGVVVKAKYHLAKMQCSPRTEQ